MFVVSIQKIIKCIPMTLIYYLDISSTLPNLVWNLSVPSAVGPGSIPWMITGEMFTQGPRPAATAACVLVNWSANLLV